MYATPSELASYLQQDLDTATATLVLEVLSERFAEDSLTRFEPTSATYAVAGTGASVLILPFEPVIAVAAVRVNGVAVTDYTAIGGVLYRLAGFGSRLAFPPDLVEIDLSYGYATAPDDVKGAVLESAALAYQNPDRVMSEAIDDYSVRYLAESGGMQLSAGARSVAAFYRGVQVA